jgi:hypothetical protein
MPGTFQVNPMYPTRSPQPQIRGIRKNPPLIPEKCKLLQRSHQRFLGFELSAVETRERKRDTSVVDPRVELDDYRTAPDGLEEVRRRLHRAACSPAAAAGLVRAAGAHLSQGGGCERI